jgi:uncharacterized repeat protein (TIGR03803 family)
MGGRRLALGRIVKYRQKRCIHPQHIEQLEPRRLFTNYSITALASVGSTVGIDAESTPVVDSSGDVFGTAISGGANGDGSIFELKAGQHSVTPLGSFGTENAQPTFGNVVMDSSGDLFASDDTTDMLTDDQIVEIPSGGSLATIFNFDPGGAQGYTPTGGLTLHEPAKIVMGQGVGVDLLGMTPNGAGNNYGGVFDLSDVSGTLTFHDLLDFPSTRGALGGGLVRDFAGNVFGTTYTGGSSNEGVIFEIPNGSGVEFPVSFNGTDGANPVGAPIYDAKTGNIFGMAEYGGTDDEGVIYEFSNGAITALASFNITDGAVPEGSLYEDAQGDLFGTTPFGGADGLGTAFELPAGSNTIKTLASFDGPLLGQTPVGGLAADANGNLYGVTESGGANGDGVVYELSPLRASQLKFDSQPQGAQTGKTIAPSVTVDVEDADGDLMTGDNSTITLGLTGMPAGVTLGGTVSAQAVNGVATFSDLSVDTAGQYTLTATDGSLAAATSGQFSIVTPVPHVAFAQQPTTATAGVKFAQQVVIDLLGADNSLQTTAKPTKVTITTTDPNGKPFHFTSVAKKGVATFKNISFKAAGSYTLSAVGGTFAQANSSAISVAPSAAKKMQFTTPPAATTHGTVFIVQIELLDKLGNIATNDDSTVTIALAGKTGGVTLGGTLTAAVTDGLATFSDLSIDTAGKAYALKLVDGKLHLLSKKFAVS